MTTTTFPMMQALWPAQEDAFQRIVRNVLLALVFSTLVALCAHIAVPIPGSPVPMTMQTFAVMLSGTLLGSRLGAGALVLYLAEGLCGIPVFAPARAAVSGMAVFALPTFGYLIGFIAAAYVAGMLAERGWDRKPLSMLGLVLGANGAIYLIGIGWLTLLPGIGSLARAFTLGIAPFLIGDALKSMLAATMLPAGWKLLDQWKRV